ncbi:MAG: chemotaxis protein CheD [Myxococcales bacterium]
MSVSGQCAPEPALEHYLYPGLVCAFAGRCVITTMLATCVAVCLWDPKAAVGGANHYLVPHEASDERVEGLGRFGPTAFRELSTRLEAAGARRERLRAKVFGGTKGRGAADRGLGERNAELAFRLLGERRIPVEACDTGGDRSRKLLFHTDDGRALVSYF